MAGIFQPRQTNKSSIDSLLENLRIKQPSSQAGSISGSSMNTGINQLAKSKIDMMTEQLQKQQMLPALEALGIPKEYVNLPTPALTQLIKQAQQQKMYQQFLEEEQAKDQGQRMQPPLDKEEQEVDEAGNIIQPKIEPKSSIITPEIKAKERAGIISSSEVEKMKAKEKIHQDAMEMENKKIAALDLRSEKKEANLENKKYKEKVFDKSEAAKTAIPDLKTLKNLLEKGNLPTPSQEVFYNIIENMLGVKIPSLRGADGEEFNSILKQFMREMKDIFGARITNFEADLFLRALPTLDKTKEGNLKIIRNLQRMYKLGVKREKVVREVEKEFREKNKPAWDLKEEVDNRMKEYEDQEYKKFRRDSILPELKKFVPKDAKEGDIIRDKFDREFKIVNENGILIPSLLEKEQKDIKEY